MLLRAALGLSVFHLYTTAFALSSVQRQSPSSCSGNTPANRESWCSHSIDTDYTREIPETGVTREYWLDIVDVVAAPDGVSRPAMGNNS